MSFSEIEIKQIHEEVSIYIESRRPPPHIRSELDISFRLQNQSVEIFEIRPDWKNKSKINEHAVAKASYVKTKNHWKIYWMRADLKWHNYDPKKSVKKLSQFLEEVEKDPYGCFWG